MKNFFILLGFICLSVNLHSQESPKGHMIIYSDPYGATVRIKELKLNKEVFFNKKIELNNIDAGTYDISFKYESCSFTGKVNVVPGDTIMVLGSLLDSTVRSGLKNKIRTDRADWDEKSKLENDSIKPEFDPLLNMLFQMPEFNGGDPAIEFRKFIAKNLRYPDICAEKDIQGRVVVQFSVNSKGRTVDAVVVEGADPSLDKEALRVVYASPKWKPGLLDGKEVKVLFSFPMNFVLQ